MKKLLFFIFLVFCADRIEAEPYERHVLYGPDGVQIYTEGSLDALKNLYATGNMTTEQRSAGIFRILPQGKKLVASEIKSLSENFKARKAALRTGKDSDPIKVWDKVTKHAEPKPPKAAVGPTSGIPSPYTTDVARRVEAKALEARTLAAGGTVASPPKTPARTAGSPDRTPETRGTLGGSTVRSGKPAASGLGGNLAGGPSTIIEVTGDPDTEDFLEQTNALIEGTQATLTPAQRQAAQGLRMTLDRTGRPTPRSLSDTKIVNVARQALSVTGMQFSSKKPLKQEGPAAAASQVVLSTTGAETEAAAATGAGAATGTGTGTGVGVGSGAPVQLENPQHNEIKAEIAALRNALTEGPRHADPAHAAALAALQGQVEWIATQINEAQYLPRALAGSLEDQIPAIHRATVGPIEGLKSQLTALAALTGRPIGATPEQVREAIAPLTAAQTAHTQRLTADGAAIQAHLATQTAAHQTTQGQLVAVQEALRAASTSTEAAAVLRQNALLNQLTRLQETSDAQARGITALQEAQASAADAGGGVGVGGGHDRGDDIPAMLTAQGTAFTAQQAEINRSRETERIADRALFSTELAAGRTILTSQLEILQRERAASQEHERSLMTTLAQALAAARAHPAPAAGAAGAALPAAPPAAAPQAQDPQIAELRAQLEGLRTADTARQVSEARLREQLTAAQRESAASIAAHLAATQAQNQAHAASSAERTAIDERLAAERTRTQEIWAAERTASEAARAATQQEIVRLHAEAATRHEAALERLTVAHREERDRVAAQQAQLAAANQQERERVTAQQIQLITAHERVVGNITTAETARLTATGETERARITAETERAATASQNETTRHAAAVEAETARAKLAREGQTADLATFERLAHDHADLLQQTAEKAMETADNAMKHIRDGAVAASTDANAARKDLREAQTETLKAITEEAKLSRDEREAQAKRADEERKRASAALHAPEESKLLRTTSQFVLQGASLLPGDDPFSSAGSLSSDAPHNKTPANQPKQPIKKIPTSTIVLGSPDTEAIILDSEFKKKQALLERKHRQDAAWNEHLQGLAATSAKIPEFSGDEKAVTFFEAPQESLAARFAAKRPAKAATATKTLNRLAAVQPDPSTRRRGRTRDGDEIPDSVPVVAAAEAVATRPPSGSSLPAAPSHSAAMPRTDRLNGSASEEGSADSLSTSRLNISTFSSHAGHALAASPPKAAPIKPRAETAYERSQYQKLLSTPSASFSTAGFGGSKKPLTDAELAQERASQAEEDAMIEEILNPSGKKAARILELDDKITELQRQIDAGTPDLENSLGNRPITRKQILADQIVALKRERIKLLGVDSFAQRRAQIPDQTYDIPQSPSTTPRAPRAGSPLSSAAEAFLSHMKHSPPRTPTKPTPTSNAGDAFSEAMHKRPPVHQLAADAFSSIIKHPQFSARPARAPSPGMIAHQQRTIHAAPRRSP